MMDPDLNDLEKELESFSPRAPSDDLERGIRQALEGEPKHRGDLIVFNRPVLGALAAAAACLAVAAGWLLLNPVGEGPGDMGATVAEESSVQPPVVAPAGDTGLLEPVAVASFVVNRTDEGAVRVGNNPPVRRVRYQFLDHVQWRNSESGVTLEVTIPREEVRLVAMEVY